MKLGLIFNPTARGNKARHFRESLDRLGRDVRVLPTRGPGDARTLAKELTLEGCKTLVAVGGDGTVNEVLNGICDAPEGLARTRLGVIPLGTVNVFAKEMRIPVGFEGAWRVVQVGHERLIDVPHAEFTRPDGALERRHFVLMAGSGLSARAVARVNWSLKKRVGPLAYIWAGLQALRPPLPELEVALRGTRHSTPWIEVGNGIYYGGRFAFFPNARLDDGAIDVLVLPRVNGLILARTFFRVLAHRLMNSPDVRHFQTSELTLTSRHAMPFHLDGDCVGNLPARITVRPRALRVLVP
ncbi:MAG TPA: diacylglycerol kinase family lipid kinase [Verrucomicrobiota bacterium]|nr:diacylglycerol kinase [Verrucomicrobiales bacterium]HRI13260.1 diacylglycerol kinase family lipid kinase [Verrucomicrobiota bacterium]